MNFETEFSSANTSLEAIKHFRAKRRVIADLLEHTIDFYNTGYSIPTEKKKKS